MLAIADKADSIAGMFALGLQPTGSKDPFALRRAANGIVKIIAEHKLPLPIAKLFSDARAEYAGSEAEKRFDQKIELRRSRLQTSCASVWSSTCVTCAALPTTWSMPCSPPEATTWSMRLPVPRLSATVRGSEDFASISVAFKRMKNILRQAKETDKHVAGELDPSALSRRIREDSGC